MYELDIAYSTSSDSGKSWLARGFLNPWADVDGSTSDVSAVVRSYSSSGYETNHDVQTSCLAVYCCNTMLDVSRRLV